MNDERSGGAEMTPEDPDWDGLVQPVGIVRPKGKQHGGVPNDPKVPWYKSDNFYTGFILGVGVAAAVAMITVVLVLNLSDKTITDKDRVSPTPLTSQTAVVPGVGTVTVQPPPNG